MEHFLGNIVASIELSLLESFRQLEEWNDNLLLLFNWIADMEVKGLINENLCVVLLNEDKIFYKEVGAKKINIHTSPYQIRPIKKEQQTVAILVRDFDANTSKLATVVKRKLLALLNRLEVLHYVSEKVPKSCLGAKQTTTCVIEMIINNS